MDEQGLCRQLRTVTEAISPVSLGQFTQGNLTSSLSTFFLDIIEEDMRRGEASEGFSTPTLGPSLG